MFEKYLIILASKMPKSLDKFKVISQNGNGFVSLKGNITIGRKCKPNKSEEKRKQLIK